MQELFRHPEDIKIAGLSGSLEGKRVIIQGFGNVGRNLARFLEKEDGCRIVGIIKSDGALLHENGISVDAVADYIAQHGGIKGFPDANYEEHGSKALEADCDILIPAALENQITTENADRIRAALIAEAANGPVTFEADEILLSRGKLILPDVYANAGGVKVSYLEWIKNLSHIRFGRLHRRFDEERGQAIVDTFRALTGQEVPEHLRKRVVVGAAEIDLVRSGLDDTMRQAYQEIREIFHSRNNVKDLRTAAFVVGIEKIARAYIEMGI